MTSPGPATASTTPVPLLGMHRPVIGMVHFPALPGSPFSRIGDRRGLLALARRDLESLLEAGIDAVSFSNEGDRPYVTETPKEILALFTWLVSELSRDLTVPFGCGVLIDPQASLAVAAATGARFVRVSYGVTAGAFGLIDSAPGAILRYRHRIGAGQVALFANFSAHFGSSLDSRGLVEQAVTSVGLAAPEAIQVHGPGAGRLPDLRCVHDIKAAVPRLPVIVASGVTVENLEAVLPACDGIIVGTSLKIGGDIYEPVDPVRAQRFMDLARSLRGQSGR